MTRLKNIKALALTGMLALLILIISSPGAIATDSDQYVPGKLVERTLSAVGRHYVNPSQINTQEMLDKALDAIQKLVPDVIVRDRTSGQLSVTAGLATKRIKMKSTYRLSELSRAIRARVTRTIGLGIRHLKLVPPGGIDKTTSGKLARKATYRRYAEAFSDER